MAGPPPRFAFADETFRDRSNDLPLGYYQLAAVLVEGADVAKFRADVAQRAGTGAEFKASELANRGDRQAVSDMLDLVSEAPCFNVIVVHDKHRMQQEAARQRCLNTLLRELNSQKVYNLTLDSRESILGDDPEVRNKVDLETRRRLARSRDIDRNMRVAHRHDNQEQLLWVPDAVGWAHRRHLLLGDSELWERIDSITTVIEI